MGFRIGWWKKWFGITWGPRSGFRLYGMFGGRGGKRGCLLPFVMIIASGFLAIGLVVAAIF